MGVDNKVRQIYEQVIHEVTQSQDAWKSVLRLAGQIYRYEFDNILMVYAQKPNATLVADFDTWKKVGRFVKCGSKGAAIYPSKALNPYMRYVFDISDTGGRQTNSHGIWKETVLKNSWIIRQKMAGIQRMKDYQEKTQ